MPHFSLSKRFRVLIPLCFVAVIWTGCGHTVSTPPVSEPVLSPVETFLATEDPGQSAILDDPQFGDNIRITVEDTFTSANGEQCKRGTVLSSRGDAEVIVICRDAHGSWKMAPRVWGQSIEER